MDEHPRKRRRTASASPHELQRVSSSPLKKPPRRPSFASPTKASLARYNPSLLQSAPRRKSPEKQSRGEIVSRGKKARSFIFGEQPSDGLSEYIARHEGQDEEEGEDVSAGAQQRVKGKEARAGAEEEESKLPTTLSGAMQPDRSNRGALFSSPSKRPPSAKNAPQQLPTKSRQPGQPKRRSVSASAGAQEEQEHAETGPAKKRERLDPEVEAKRREKEALLRELRDLEGDVAQCRNTIHKLQDPTPKILKPSERDDLISLINKLSDADFNPEDQPAPISLLLNSFLPFTAHAIAPPPTTSEEVDKEIIPSHRPLDLDDPLPYLSMFTPFTYTSRLSIPDSGSLDHQVHTIDISGPAKLLTASISATVDTKTHRVTDLQIGALSHWAESELGTFMRKKAEQRDLSCACWALGSFWEISKKRAEYWRRCETAFPHLLPNQAMENSENMAGQDREMQTIKANTMSRKDLLRHLGRDTLVLQDDHVLLKFHWRINFDWTGEAESQIGVEGAFPSVWSEADNTQSLKKIPQTFASLMESRGAFEATKVMVALLFAE